MGRRLLLQMVIVKPAYRHELGIPGLIDMLDVPRDWVLENCVDTVIVYQAHQRSWQPGQFMPREVSAHFVEGEQVDVDRFDLSPAAHFAVMRWNERRVAA